MGRIVPAVERFPIPGEPNFVDNRDVSILLVVGRLKAGVPIETAQADVDRIVRELAAVYGRTGRVASTMAPLVDDAIGSARIRLWALLAAVALLLTAAAANVAGLLLVQMSARRREFAVRMALGASVGAIARDLLCEAALLTAVASSAAFVAARAALPLLLAIVPADLPRVEQAVIGGRALVYTVAVGAFVTAVCALLPLLTLRTSPLEQALRDGGRTGTANRQNRRTRRLLVVGEMAIAVIILTCAALLYRSVASLTRLDVGFAADRLVAIEVHAPSAQTADRTKEHGFYTRVIMHFDAAVGRMVAGVAGRPLKGPIGLDSSWQREGQALEEAKHNPWANLETVTPGISRRWAFGCSKGGPSPTTTGWKPGPSRWSARRSPGGHGRARPPSASDSVVMASTKDALCRRGGPSSASSPTCATATCARRRSMSTSRTIRESSRSATSSSARGTGPGHHRGDSRAPALGGPGGSDPHRAHA